MKTRTQPTRRHPRGFSLVEMLVVIAVIGVIAGIAVPTIGNITSNADEGATKRNAQNLCSLHTAAVAAGYDFNTEDKSEIAAQLKTGVTGPAIAGSDFRLKLSDGEVDDALAYCSYDPISGTMTYSPGGGEAALSSPYDWQGWQINPERPGSGMYMGEAWDWDAGGETAPAHTFASQEEAEQVAAAYAAANGRDDFEVFADYYDPAEHPWDDDPGEEGWRVWVFKP